MEAIGAIVIIGLLCWLQIVATQISDNDNSRGKGMMLRAVTLYRGVGVREILTASIWRAGLCGGPVAAGR